MSSDNVNVNVNVNDMKNNWNCQICDTNEYYPMMITKCGHTFCENCLKRLNVCPICRIPYLLYDCQPNYILVSDKQPLNRNMNLDNELNDLCSKLQMIFKSKINNIVLEIVRHINKCLIEDPEKLIFEFNIISPTPELIYNLIKLFDPYGIYIHIKNNIINLPIDEYPDNIKIDIHYKPKYNNSLNNSLNNSENQNNITNLQILPITSGLYPSILNTLFNT